MQQILRSLALLEVLLTTMMGFMQLLEQLDPAMGILRSLVLVAPLPLEVTTEVFLQVERSLLREQVVSI